MEKNYKSNIYKTYIFTFIFGIHTVRAVYYPYMTVWGGLTFFQIMILQSYFTAMILLLEIPSGAISDFLGRKTGLSLAAFVTALAAVFYSIIPNFFMFMLAESFWAFGIALFSGTYDAFLYSSLKSYGEEGKLSKIIGRTQFLNLVALTLSAPIGSVIAQFISLQFTMNCLAIVYFSGFIVSLTFKEPKLVDDTYQKEHYLTIVKSGFKELKNKKTLRILAFDLIPINALIFLLFWTWQPYFTELNIPIIYFGFISSIMNITNAIFTILLPKWLKHAENKKRVLITVNVISGVAYIAAGFITHIPLGIIIVLVIVAFGYSRFLLFVDGINKQIESENRATVLSTINMFRSLIAAIIFPFVGIIVTWNLFMFFVLIGIVILFLTIFTRSKSEYL